MKLLDILGKVGSSVVKAVVPGGGLIIDIVNELLPDDKKLPNDATGQDVTSAVGSLPPEQQAQLLDREFDVTIKEHDTLQVMLKSDADNPHTTRPKIALYSFWLVAGISQAIAMGWLYAVINDKADMVEKIVNGWPFVAAIVGPFVTMLLGYFGILRKEHATKYNAAIGGQPSILQAVASRILKG